jgi:hypothetical protein
MVVKKIYGHKSGFFEQDAGTKVGHLGQRGCHHTPMNTSSDSDQSFDPHKVN